LRFKIQTIGAQHSALYWYKICRNLLKAIIIVSK
jgi:hypothetical protein